jgi:hypothetical protein
VLPTHGLGQVVENALQFVDVELDQYEDWYWLSYGRGPESFIAALAAQLS